ncbi:MAG: hypothetical protein JWO13_2009 [Acidobacteriales bacterium]|nr:hypothetical protein [Terriglobales bacterium]
MNKAVRSSLKVAEQMSVSDLGGVLEAAMQIATGRRETIARLRAALEQNDTLCALQLARQLCGLNEESNRANSRIN